jgi:hypothetical protein
MYQTPTMTYFGNDVQTDIDLTLAIYAELAAMKAPRALELSIDRLLRSRLGRSLEDKIIDLGMAAEIALMHSPDGGDGKSEITNRLSSRGAWLVADNPTDRLSASALLSRTLFCSIKSGAYRTRERQAAGAGRGFRRLGRQDCPIAPPPWGISRLEIAGNGWIR